MRIVLMGTGPFAVPSFRALFESKLDSIALCVTKSLAPSTGKAKGPTNPVFEWASGVGLPIFQPASINLPEAIERLKGVEADLFVVCDYGQILSREALAASRLGGINLHGSLLPRHRGAAPVQWAVLRGDPISGISVIHMSPRLDAGSILTRAETPLMPNENAAELEHRLAMLGVESTLNAVAILRDISQSPSHDPQELDRLGTQQDEGLSTKARRLSKGDGQLDFRHSSETIDRLVRGLQPWPGAYGEIEIEPGKRIRVAILRCRSVRSDRLSQQDHACGKLIWGDSLKEQLTSDSGELAVVCRDGLLIIDELQPAGKRAMKAREFLMGYQRNPAMAIVEPAEPNRLLQQLEKA